MSYDISLECHCCGNSVRAPKPHEEGGTYILGGNSDCELNVTYNYSELFDFRGQLNGKRAAETITVLKEARDRLGTDRAPDYWKPTPGNVGYALEILLQWAQWNPSAVWRIS